MQSLPRRSLAKQSQKLVPSVTAALAHCTIVDEGEDASARSGSLFTQLPHLLLSHAVQPLGPAALPATTPKKMQVAKSAAVSRVASRPVFRAPVSRGAVRVFAAEQKVFSAAVQRALP